MTRRRLLILAQLGAVALSARVTSAQISQQGKTAAVSRAIDEFWGRAADVLKKGDVAGATAMYTDDAMIIEPSSPTAAGKAEIEAYLKQGFASLKVLNLTHTQTALEVFGNLAVENGTFDETFQEPGKPPRTVQSRYTLVFKNVNGKWLALRDVSTPMPPTSPAK